MIVWPTVFTLLVEAVGLNQGKEKNNLLLNTRTKYVSN